MDQAAHPRARCYTLISRYHEPTQPGEWKPRLLATPNALRMADAELVLMRLDLMRQWGQALALPDCDAFTASSAVALIDAYIIRYRYCFDKSSGRKFVLTEKHVSKSQGHDVEFHRLLLNVADKAVAHPDSWVEQAEPVMHLNEDGALGSIGFQGVVASPLRRGEIQRLSAIADGLFNIVLGEIREIKQILFQELNVLLPSDRLKAAPATSYNLDDEREVSPR